MITIKSAREIETMHEAGVRTLVVEAGKAIVFDRDEMVGLANRCNIAILARKD